jgi:hypothetical protein
LVAIPLGCHDAAICQHHLRRHQIVERKAEPADQRPLAAAKREPDHADCTAQACRGGEVQRIGCRKYV